MRGLAFVIGTVLLAVLGLAAPASASAQVTSAGWYGYAVTGSTYTSTTADWTMPSLTCGGANGSYVDIWTGLDGYSSDSIEQVGATAACSGGIASYYAWYEVYPAAPVDWSKTVKPGDKLDASVVYDGSNKFTLTMDDVTQGWTQSATKALAGAARSSAETVVGPSSNLKCTANQTLAAFTGDTVDGSALGSLDPVKVTGTDPDIVVSPVSGKTFSVTCD
jgi:Peptidase A4 family